MFRSISHFWPRKPVILLIALAMLGAASHAAAEAPMQKSQAPGYYRMMLGQVEITALCDGLIDLDTSVLKNISPPDAQNLLARALVDNHRKVPTATNAFLVNTGAKLVLIDAGGGTSPWPTLGRLPRNIRASGYMPEQIDAVLLTHLHSDHCAGLIDAQRKPVYPNAVVYVSKAEHDHWFDAAETKDVPGAYQKLVPKSRKLVHDVAGPYVAANRWKTFDGAELPFAGIKAVAAAGHTAGHTAYEISSEGQTLVILGDMVHFPMVQFTRPDAAVAFDANPTRAVAAREALFRRLADGKTFVAGMHLPFPGIGRLRAEGQNAYAWVPIEYSPTVGK
jgi:glyoxylase-like metal-dependent hydrolase (beta-lactamase superfamily II)